MAELTVACRRLLRTLRDCQQRLRDDPDGYSREFGRLEWAVTEHLGVSCIHCGRASTGEDRLCDGCRARHDAGS